MIFTKHDGDITWSLALVNPPNKPVPLLHLMKRLLGMDAIGLPWLKLSDFGK